MQLRVKDVVDECTVLEEWWDVEGFYTRQGDFSMPHRYIFIRQERKIIYGADSLDNNATVCVYDKY